MQCIFENKLNSVISRVSVLNFIVGKNKTKNFIAWQYSWKMWFYNKFFNGTQVNIYNQILRIVYLTILFFSFFEHYSFNRNKWVYAQKKFVTVFHLMWRTNFGETNIMMIILLIQEFAKICKESFHKIRECNFITTYKKPLKSYSVQLHKRLLSFFRIHALKFNKSIFWNSFFHRYSCSNLLKIDEENFSVKNISSYSHRFMSDTDYQL